MREKDLGFEEAVKESKLKWYCGNTAQDFQ
jgi:hypothetical protein